MKINPVPEKKQETKNSSIILSALLVIAIVVIILLAFKSCGNGASVPSAETQNSEITTATTVQTLTDSIDIPGFASIILTADQLEQQVQIQNPSENFCLFRISLLLEDGTVLWTSDYVKPGENSEPIVLTKPLEAGTYANAVLRYECFRNDESKTSLNGSQSKLTLVVK